MDTNWGPLVHEKLSQAARLLDQANLDLWLTFVSETSLRRDPALDLICPFGLTWHSAFLITRDGQSLALVGRYDAPNLERLRAYSRVLGYDQSLRPLLTETLRQLSPGRVALNFSRSDPASDGLTYGLKLALDEILQQAGVPAERVVSAEAVLGRLRGCKTPGEVERIRRAVATTEALLQEVGERIRPGISERSLAHFLHERLHSEGLEPAWELEADPLVNTGPGPESPGHALPTDRVVEPGYLVHFDFGVRQEGFCADLQRMWYVLKEDERDAPEDVLRVWQGVRGALLAGAEALRPGVQGWQVDQAARQVLVGQGLPEYLHAFGHHLGHRAHDGSTVLGPRWERYGDAPYGVVEAGNVFALELGAPVPGRGWVYLEEDVLVTEAGVEWLSQPQTEVRLIGGRA